MRSWLKKGCLVCAIAIATGLLIAIVLGGIFLVQGMLQEPEEHRLAQQVRTADIAPCRVVLSLSSASVKIRAGPAGEPIRVESNFDPAVHELEQSYEEDDSGARTYRLDFHEKRLLHVAVVSVWLGVRSPEVVVVIPRDLRLDLEATMEGGYLSLDLSGLELTTADIELDRGVLGLIVSEPLHAPMERLNVKGRIGTMVLRSIGNASPRTLNVQHSVGATFVDLSGMWLRDADIEYRMTFGDGALQLPEGVDVEGLEGAPFRLVDPAEREVPVPTLHLSTHADMGEIQVVD